MYRFAGVRRTVHSNILRVCRSLETAGVALEVLISVIDTTIRTTPTGEFPHSSTYAGTGTVRYTW
jgi:hypothetical protein